MPVLGICLGAQRLADVPSARVSANTQKKIGWFSVTRTDPIPDGFMGILPENQTVFHWHGDTFALPIGAVPLYSSNVCGNQAFLYKDRVLALQFHLEAALEHAIPLIHNCRNELVPGPSIPSVMVGQG